VNPVSTVVCPACVSTAEVVRWDDISAYACESCKGHCVSPAALRAFLAQHLDPKGHARLQVEGLLAKASSRALSCPFCDGKKWRALPSSGIEVDLCAGCGAVYLDPGELQSYLDNSRSHESKVLMRDVVLSSGELIPYILSIFKGII
jgi:Zn-finger nucleic acid-binding protein